MSRYTTRGYIYPDADDANDVPLFLKSLAEGVDADVTDVEAAIAATSAALTGDMHNLETRVNSQVIDLADMGTIYGKPKADLPFFRLSGNSVVMTNEFAVAEVIFPRPFPNGIVELNWNSGDFKNGYVMPLSSDSGIQSWGFRVKPYTNGVSLGPNRAVRVIWSAMGN